MVVMPGITATAFTNIYTLIAKGGKNTQSLFAQIFLFEKGDFFTALILQSGATSFFYTLTSLNQILYCYLSPMLLVRFKPITSINQINWTKADYDVFTFGISYGQNIVVMGVGLIFR